MSHRHTEKRVKRTRRHHRVRVKVRGTHARPRLVVFRSLKHMYGQVIDDHAGKTLAAASDREVGSKTKGKLNPQMLAQEVGKLLAKKARAAGITRVVFDRSSYKYHGRVKAFADGAREGGLEF